MQRGAVQCGADGIGESGGSSTAAVTPGVSCVLLRLALAGEGTLERSARARFPPLSPGQTTTALEAGVCALRAAAFGIQH